MNLRKLTPQPVPMSLTRDRSGSPVTMQVNNWRGGLCRSQLCLEKVRTAMPHGLYVFQYHLIVVTNMGILDCRDCLQAQKVKQSEVEQN